MKKVKISFHGHSHYSDGLDNISDLVRKAAEAGINYFGISDHFSVSGVPELYQEIDKTNLEMGAEMVPVMAVEIETVEGDVVVAKGGQLDPEFLAWAGVWAFDRQRYSVFETIKTAVERFDAIVVIVHPGSTILQAVSFNNLVKLKKELSPTVWRNVGLEVINWSTALFMKFSDEREARLKNLAKELDAATFGFTDFHQAWQIPYLWTEFETDQVTPQALLEAVRKRKVAPAGNQRVGLRDRFNLARTFGTAFVKYRKPPKYKNLDKTKKV